LISGDGSLLIASELWKTNNWMDNLSYPGSRFYVLPELKLLAESHFPPKTGGINGHELADDGSVWSRTTVAELADLRPRKELATKLAEKDDAGRPRRHAARWVYACQGVVSASA
jgi:hypothetical protein